MGVGHERFFALYLTRLLGLGFRGLEFRGRGILISFVCIGHKRL